MATIDYGTTNGADADTDSNVRTFIEANGKDSMVRYVPNGMILHYSAKDLGLEYFKNNSVRECLYGGDLDDEDTRLLTDPYIYYNKDAHVLYTVSKNVDKEIIARSRDKCTGAALSLARSGLAVRYDATYVYCPDNSYWLPLRSPEGTKYLLSTLGITNVTVNYSVAADPYIKIIEDNALTVHVPPNTVCIGRSRFKFTVSNNSISLKPQIVLGKFDDNVDLILPSTRTFSTRPISTPAIIINANIDKTTIIEDHLNSLLGKEVTALVMWNIGNSLIDGNTTYKTLMFQSKGGTGKSTVLTKLSWIVGDTSTTMSGNHLGSERAIPNTEIGLYTGKRFLFCGDVSLNEGKINEQSFKLLTSGDLVNYNDTSIKLSLTLFLASNDMVSSSSKYRESWFTRRMVIIPFVKRLVSSKVLRNNYEETDRLAFLLKCVARRSTNREMPVGPAVTAYTIWRKMASIITKGMTDRCERVVTTVGDILSCCLWISESVFDIDISKGLSSKPINTQNAHELSALIRDCASPRTPTAFHVYKMSYITSDGGGTIKLTKIMNDINLPEIVLSRNSNEFHYDRDYARRVTNSTAYNSSFTDDYGDESIGIRDTKFYPVAYGTRYLETECSMGNIGSHFNLNLMRKFALICEYIVEYICGTTRRMCKNNVDLGLLLAVSKLLVNCDLTNILINIQKNTWYSMSNDDRKLLYCMCSHLVKGKIISTTGILNIKCGYEEVNIERYINSRICTHVAAVRAGCDVDELIETLSTVSNTAICYARVHGIIIPHLAMNGVYMDEQFNGSLGILHDIGKTSRTNVYLSNDLNI